MTEDHLGSPRVITDDAGNVVSRHDYMAFGEEIPRANSGTDSVRDKYTGYERDNESGLDYAQARYYNSRNGRFTSVDPLTASATIKNPQTFNRYSYGLNSPYKFTDPLGLAPQGVCMDLSCSNQSAEEADYMQRLKATYDALSAEEARKRGDTDRFWEIIEGNDSLSALDEDGNEVESPNSSIQACPKGHMCFGQAANPNSSEFDTASRAKLRDYLMKSPIGDLIKGIIFGFDGNGKDVAASIEVTSTKKAVDALSFATKQFIDAHFGYEHVKELGESSNADVYDFRSYTLGKNRLGNMSLQINIGKTTGRIRADLDLTNPRQGPVSFTIHAVPIVIHKIGNFFKKIF